MWACVYGRVCECSTHVPCMTAPFLLEPLLPPGLCGVVYTLLHCLPAVREVDGAAGAGMRALRQACDALAGGLFPSGNLPSSLTSRDDR